MNRIELSLMTITMIAFGVMGSGCTTTMTSMTDARAYEPGEVQVAGNMQTTVHTNIVNGLGRGVGSTAEVIAGDEPLTDEQFRSWLDFALMTALFRPRPASSEFVMRVGLTDRVAEGIDFGFRTNATVYEGDLKLQLWENEAQNQFVSVVAGYSTHRSWLDERVSQLTLTSFSRRDFDAQAIWGMEVRDFFKLTMGPHLIASKISVSHRLPNRIIDRLPESLKKLDPNRLFQDEWLAYYGGNITMMLGYKYVFLAADLGMFWLDFEPEVLGERRDFSGAAFSAAGGISVHIPFDRIGGS